MARAQPRQACASVQIEDPTAPRGAQAEGKADAKDCCCPQGASGAAGGEVECAARRFHHSPRKGCPMGFTRRGCSSDWRGKASSSCEREPSAGKGHSVYQQSAQCEEGITEILSPCAIGVWIDVVVWIFGTSVFDFPESAYRATRSHAKQARGQSDFERSYHNLPPAEEDDDLRIKIV